MVSELLGESLALLVYTIIAGVLTVGGIAAEHASIQYFGSGEATVAVWLAAIGCLLLYAGVYSIGYKKVLAQFI